MVLHINIYSRPPPCHGAIHRKGLGQGRTHSSVLTQQNQAQNVFIIIHTPQTLTMTRLFVTIIGHAGAGMQNGLPLLLSINSGARREGGREGDTKCWPRSELNIVKLVTRHWAFPPPLQQERNKMQ